MKVKLRRMNDADLEIDIQESCDLTTAEFRRIVASAINQEANIDNMRIIYRGKVIVNSNESVFGVHDIQNESVVHVVIKESPYTTIPDIPQNNSNLLSQPTTSRVRGMEFRSLGRGSGNVLVSAISMQTTYSSRRPPPPSSTPTTLPMDGQRSHSNNQRTHRIVTNLEFTSHIENAVASAEILVSLPRFTQPPSHTLQRLEADRRPESLLAIALDELLAGLGETSTLTSRQIHRFVSIRSDLR